MTDPQEAVPDSSTLRGMDCQSALHLNTFSSIYTLQVSKKKGVLDCISEITKGLGGGVYISGSLGIYLPDQTRDLGHEMLTGCGGMRTRQISSAGAPVSLLSLLPDTTSTQATRKCPRAQGLALL